MASSKAIAYEVDDGRWPLVVLRATAAVRDDAALDATYRALESQLAKGARFVLLIDARQGFSSPQRRTRLAAWGERHASQIGAVVVALAVIVGNDVERGFVTAALWHRSPPYPLRVFSDPEEAEAWLLSEYQEAKPADSQSRET